MNYLLLEEFAAECERLAEEKETEREWLSDFANLVLEEAAKVCEAQVDLEYATGKVDHNEIAWCMKLAMDIRGMKAPNAKVTGSPALSASPCGLPGYAPPLPRDGCPASNAIDGKHERDAYGTCGLCGHGKGCPK